MQQNDLVKRYLLFIIGLFVNSVGVALITKADLGTSPISSIPYALSLSFTPTLGQFTIIFSLLLIALQIYLEKRNFDKIQLLQIPVSIAFGYFIDFSMEYVVFWLRPEDYLQKLAALLVGCLVLGFGVYMEVFANVVMLPGEGVVKSITRKYHTNFGTTKICMDTTMAVAALFLSVLLTQQVQGVREGTLIAALLVGYISKCYGRIFAPVARKILPSPC